MKLFKYLAIAAFASIIAVACGKDDKGGAKLSESKYYQESITIPILSPENFNGIEQLDFFADGTGLARKQKNFVAPTGLTPRKKMAEYEYVVFTYTVNGDVYTIIGLFETGKKCTLQYDEQAGTLTIVTTENGEEKTIVVENVGQPAPNLQFDDIVKLCRKWKVKSIDIHVSGGDLSGTISGGQIFKHGDLYKIAQAIKAKGVNFNAEELNGYEITSVDFSKAGTILVQFKNKAPYAGSYNISAGGFSYQLDYGKGNNIINAEAAGSITIGGGECKLDLVGSITGSSSAYETSIAIILIPA